jgi:hypothetical protein
MTTLRRTADRVVLTAFATAIASCALLTTPSRAFQEGEAKAAQPKKRVLFDGKTLDGWKQTDFPGTGEVKVEDGMILMAKGTGMTGVTTTLKDLPTSNYELVYEAKRVSGDDFFAAATFPVGKSFITLVNGGWGGSVTGLSSLGGFDASENETSRYYKYVDKTWYKFRVRVTGEVIRCWVDDKELIAVNFEGREVGTRIETRDNQPLGFATWETGGAVRGIEVRALTPAEVAATNKLE